MNHKVIYSVVYTHLKEMSPYHATNLVFTFFAKKQMNERVGLKNNLFMNTISV